MKKTLDYKIRTEIKDNLPKIEIRINYKDDFSDDNYILISNPNYKDGSKAIPFHVIKNGELIGEIKFEQKDYEQLFLDFFNEVQDIDFKDEFFRIGLLSPIAKEMSEFMKKYNEEVVLHAFTMEGEVIRMKRMAGILKEVC